MDRAACRNVDPNLFFPNTTHSAAIRAKAICDRCPVTAACLTYVAHLIADGHVMSGIWAGRHASLIGRREAELIVERGGYDIKT